MLKSLRNPKKMKTAVRDLYLGAFALLIMFVLTLIGRLSDDRASRTSRN